MKNEVVGADEDFNNNKKKEHQLYMNRSHTDLGNNKKIKSKVPGLDFSNLKQVKDFKDWYSYAKKLEDAIRLLREKI